MTQGASTDRGGDPLAPLLRQAQALHEQGELREAATLYRQILARDGRHFAALLQLGTLGLQEGRPDEAVGLLQAAVEQNPNSAEARSNLATALQVLQRSDEAIASYEEALALDPNHVEAYYGLASVLQLRKRSDEAIACYQRALAIDPDYAEAHCGLADIYRAQERFAAAIACYEKALEIDPDYPEALQGLGNALYGDKSYEKAAASYERFLAIDPSRAEAHRNLGAVMQALDRYDEALSCYEQALALDPNLAGAQAGLGSALQELGRIDEAHHAFARAVALDPGNPRHYLSLVECKRVAPEDPVLAALEEMGRDIHALAPDARMHLDFALAKAYADIGDHDRSFRHYLDGNALKRAQLDYDEVSRLRVLDEIRTVFSPELLLTRAGNGHPSDLPIFIVGMPRSGSTLVEQILASHPKVFGGGERVDFAATLRSAGTRLPSVPFPQAVPSLQRSDFFNIAESYVGRMQNAAAAELGRSRDQPTDRATPNRITDKTLNNFLCVGLIHLALPNARIIHTRRDPVDSCLSCFSKLFGSKLAFTYDLAELGRYYRAYQRLMEHWASVLPAGAIFDVQYEDVVDDLEGQARRLVAHCGLDWDDACLAFHKTQRPVKTASVNQVRQPIYRSSVQRWRPGAELLRPLLDGLGLDAS